MSSKSFRVLVVAHPDGANQEWVANMAKSGRNGRLRSNVTSLESEPCPILAKYVIGMTSSFVNPKKLVRGDLVSDLPGISCHREALSAIFL